jgi:hypothetical protein
LQFQVNGQEYFLAFVEEERRWYLFAQMAQGIQRIPVYVDAAKQERRFAERNGTHKLS